MQPTLEQIKTDESVWIDEAEYYSPETDNNLATYYKREDGRYMFKVVGGDDQWLGWGWDLPSDVILRPTKAFVPEVGDTVMVSLGKGVIKAIGIANHKKAYFVQGDNWTETTTIVRPIKTERELFIHKAASIPKPCGFALAGIMGELYDAGCRFVETDK